MIHIRRAALNEADVLTQIALDAKRHWGYPERWMEIWKPQLTFKPSYFAENPSWVAATNDTPVAFSALLEKDGRAWLENVWASPAWIGK